MLKTKLFFDIHDEDSLDSAVDFSVTQATEYHQILSVPSPGSNKEQFSIYTIDNVLFFSKQAAIDNNSIITATYQKELNFRLVLEKNVQVSVVSLNSGVLSIGLINSDVRLMGIKQYKIFHE